MARTGKKSVKTKPAALKKQITHDRKIRKKASNSERDRALRDALDTEMTSEDVISGRKSLSSRKAGKNSSVAADELLTSFDQLRGI
jgi:hypothetical protein